MKRIISFLTAVIMCISLIGGVSFAATKDTVDGSYTYSFVAGTGNCPKEVKNKPLWDYTDYTVLPYCFFDADDMIKGFIAHCKEYIADGKEIDEDTTDTYSVASGSKKYNIVLGDFYTRLLCFNNDSYFRFRTATSNKATSFPTGRWVAIKLDARGIKEGTYDITFKSSGTNLKFCEVYLAPYDSSKTSGEDYMEDQEPIFTVEDGKSEITKKNFDVIGDADEYVLVIKHNKATETRLTSITFIPVSSLDTAKLTLSDEDNIVTTGTYLYSSVAAFDKQGNPSSVRNADVTYKSDNESVAEIDEKTGEIYAKRPGSAKIEVTVKDDIARISDSVVLTVTERFVQSELPQEIKAFFPLVNVEVGETARLKITDAEGNELGDGIEYSYDIADKSVIAEKDGTFTALRMGKTNITVTASLNGASVSTTTTVAVVGKNLFTRDGVRHGEFENSIYLNSSGDTAVDVTGGAARTETIWNATKDRIRDIYDFTHFKNVASEITGRRTSYIKVAVDDTSYEGVTTNDTRTFRVESGKNTTYAPALENGKIYEYTGFVKLENAQTFPKIQIRQQIYKISDGLEIAKDLIDQYPFDAIKKDFPWTRFCIGPFYANWDENVIARSKVQADSKNPISYDLSISYLALREVAFESVDFRMEGSFEGAKTFDKFKTSAFPVSNTGNPIFAGNTSTEIKVNYSSSNPVVAKVDENGVITAVSDGDCEIRAEITLGDVTRIGIIPVHLEGLEVMLESIKVSADQKLGVGDTTQIEVEYFNSKGEEIGGEDASSYFKSNNPQIADVTQSGIITAKNPGSTVVTVYASVSGHTVAQELEITVTDDSALDSVYIEGTDKIEIGFTAKLLAGAYHVSGSKADMTDVEYSFALKNQEDSSVLSVSHDGTVEGLSEGEAEVVLTVENPDGEPLTAEYIVKVVQGKAKRKVFDFRVYTADTSILNASIEKDGWQVNLNETSATRLEEGKNGEYKRLRFLAYGIQFLAAGVNSPKADLALDLMVDYSGWYNISFVGARNKNGCHSLVYMNGEYLGDCDFSSPEAGSNVHFTCKLNPVYLKKGINTFKLRADIAAKYLYPTRITLDYIGEEAPAPVSTILSVGEATIPFGTIAAHSVTAKMSVGNDYVFGYDLDSDFNYVVNSKRTYTLRSSDSSVVTVDDSGKLKAVGEGTARITADVTYGDYTFAPFVDITVTPKGFTTVLLSAEKTVMEPFGEKSAITVKALDNLGGEILIPNDAEIIFGTSDENVVTVDEAGYMTPHSEGSAEVTATLTLDDVTLVGKLNVSVRHGKVKSTYYTKEKIEVARENIQKYSWAKEEKKKALEKADKYLPYVEHIYDLVASPDIPRGYQVGWFDDPEVAYCRYCGKYLPDEYGKYPWKVDLLNRPWKVQCPDCKRTFPSNDFEGLYELVTENNYGIYDVELAHKLNEEVKQETDGKVDYLKNALYPEIADQVTVANGGKNGVNVTINVGKGLRPGETAEGWGVDDGLGYMPKKPDGTQYTYSIGDREIPEVHSYVSICAHFFWDDPAGKRAVFRYAVESFRDAYIYTGDRKYGIAGAVLLDRMADYYPAYDLYNDGGYDFERNLVTYQNTGGSGRGKTIGNIWEAADYLGMFATCYDAFFELYDNPQVVEFLNQKAKDIGIYELSQSEEARFDKYDRLSDKFLYSDDGAWKITPETLRQNIENGLLKESLPAVKSMQIAGNFGFKQNTLAKCAVVLDTQPYTQEIIDFVMASGEASGATCTGGNVMPQIINVVDRDGFGNESSLNYNRIWAANLLEMAQTLGAYENVELDDDLLANPKYIKMLQLEFPTMLASKRQATIGDMGDAVSADLKVTHKLFLAALDSVDKWNASEEFKKEKRILFSQALYLANGNTVDELHYDIFTKNPESLQDEVKKAINQYGEYDMIKSSIATGFGFAALRAGIDFSGKASSSDIDNTTRDFFLYFGGGNTAHHHYDGLSLGMDAYGIDMMPDLGYPSSTGGDNNYLRHNWSSGTVSHNTVVVNDERQRKMDYAGNPLHFDDSGEIKVMDVDMPEVYGKYVDTYRRTVVSVDVDDTVSYGIDFFRIIGGDEHVYSFHSRAFEAELDENIKTVKQPIGTYAGADIPYADVNYSIAHDSGYEYLDNVSRAVNPQTGKFWMDFDVEKINNIPVTKQDWHLRFTMLNDFDLSEIALADGYAPPYGDNPTEPFRYVLARRSGKNLDTLFTTVFEPYVGKSNLKSLERVGVTLNGKPVKESDGVAAVRVTLNNGRVDYVVYATDNTVTYRIDDRFDFSGFVGVYTVTEEDPDNYVRSYVLDGTKVGETSATSSVTGMVSGFTKELAFENYVDIELDSAVENCDELVGKLLVIENDGQRNGAYTVTSAKVNGNILTLGVGDITFIRSFVDSFDTSKGYYYNIEEGQRASIALSSYNTSAPDIAPIENQTVSAGSTIKIPVNASSAYGRNITLEGTTLPRGMSVNAETGTLTWKPDASQVGDNHVAITANDGILTSTVRFTVTVYGSTTGNKPATPETPVAPSVPGTDSGNGGATSGGGGGGTAPDNNQTDVGIADLNDPNNTDSTKFDETGNDDASTQPGVGNGGSDVPQFADLGNYAWAADAINTLADDGIIRGTTSDTYSPANNITRADFASLLVRAFNLTSDNAENFADVSTSDYFASELAIARNNGIVSGICDNKFAPRNTITRQDMMVIVYRALQNLNVGLGVYDEPQYIDFVSVAPYARDAVSALIGAGLVNGKSGKIAPVDYTTRAEVAVLIKRILEYTRNN